MKEKREAYAFIEYEELRDAEEAYERTNGLELHGRKLRVEFSHGGR
jgi:RNA recognition motif-containing protein